MYNYKATVTRVVDGDTIDCDVDLGFKITTHQRFRLLGIDTPELRGVERSAGLDAKAYVESLILNKDITISTAKGDSFGRWLAEVWLDTEEIDSLNQHLLDTGYAVPYDR